MKSLSDYDLDLQYLCKLTLQKLQDDYHYNESKSIELLTKYLHMFFNDELCKELPVQNQSEDYIHHSGFANLARAVHYTLTLKKEINAEMFHDWLIIERQRELITRTQI